MTRFSTLAVWAAIVIVAVAGDVAWREYQGSADSCTSDQAMDRLHRVLRDQYSLTSVFINDVETTSGGGPFATTRHCAAQVASLRSDVTAKDLDWHGLDYTVARESSGRSAVTAELGGPVKLDPSTFR